MKVKYRLTWEEFAELHRNSWPRPDFFSSIVTAMVALPLIGYGISLAIFGAPDEPVLYSLFIGGPLLLLALAAIALKSHSGQTIKRAVDEKRVEYERWHSREQSFSYDQEKWMHEAEAGKQEVPWQATLTARDSSRILSLTGEGASVIIPERVLDEATVGELRRLALLASGAGWPYQIKCWDYQVIGTAMLWRKYWFRMAFGNLFGAAILGWVVQNWLTSSEKVGVVWGWILASLAVVLTLTAQLWYLPLQYFTSRENWRAPQTVEFSAQGVLFSDSDGDLFRAWKAFREFAEATRAFLLYVDLSRCYILPKRCFSFRQQTEIREILEKNLKRKSTLP